VENAAGEVEQVIASSLFPVAIRSDCQLRTEADINTFLSVVSELLNIFSRMRLIPLSLHGLTV
jgi:hypothetical protein